MNMETESTQAPTQVKYFTDEECRNMMKIIYFRKSSHDGIMLVYNILQNSSLRMPDKYAEFIITVFTEISLQEDTITRDLIDKYQDPQGKNWLRPLGYTRLDADFGKRWVKETGEVE